MVKKPSARHVGEGSCVAEGVQAGEYPNRGTNLLLHRILAWPRAQEGLLAAICKIEKIKQFAIE